MFKLQNHVPEVFVNESRDFQLFTRIFDLAFNSTKYSVNSLKHTCSTNEVNSQLIYLLSYKLGLFTYFDIDEKKQRMVLTAIPHILRNKGSLKCVNQVIYLFSRLSNTKGYIQYVTSDNIKLVFEDKVIDEKLLLSILEYVLPTSYIIEYVVSDTSTIDTTQINSSDTLAISGNNMECAKLTTKETETTKHPDIKTAVTLKIGTQ